MAKEHSTMKPEGLLYVTSLYDSLSVLLIMKVLFSGLMSIVNSQDQSGRKLVMKHVIFFKSNS